MSETKHTPGPWVYDPEGDYIWTESDGDESPDLIADIRGHGGNLPVEANARLIAAAPEMLAELKRQVQRLYNGFEPDNQSAEYQRVIALIRKAEGQ